MSKRKVDGADASCGAEVDAALHPDNVQRKWGTYKKHAMRMLDMWELMVRALEGGACVKALAEHGVTDMAGLYRLADARFSVMDTQPSACAALDTMVAAAAFGRDGLTPLQNWLEAVPEVQCEQGSRKDTFDFTELYCSVEGDEAFGFEVQPVCAGLRALFDDQPSDAAFIAAIGRVESMDYPRL